jgi:hypothetical protein
LIKANEIEGIIINRLKGLSKGDCIMKQLVRSANDKLQKALFDLKDKNILLQNELVMLALNKFTDTFDYLKPYRQKEFLRLVFHKAILGTKDIKIYNKIYKKYEWGFPDFLFSICTIGYRLLCPDDITAHYKKKIQRCKKNVKDLFKNTH